MADVKEEVGKLYIDFAESHRRMKKAQVDSGKSIVDIAEALGISAGYLGLFIRTRDILGLNILVGLAVETNTTTDYLLGLANNPARPESLRFTAESMRAVELMDKLPEPARQHILGIIYSLAEVWTKTTQLQDHVVRTALALEEAGVNLDLESIKVGQATLADFLGNTLGQGEGNV